MNQTKHADGITELTALHNMRFAAIKNAKRVATLGNWPAWIEAPQSLLSRVPYDLVSKAPGLDAGLACALGLIPEDKQKLAATLHAAYTPEAVDQVRSESVIMDPDSETAWWLAACAICQEGEVDGKKFLDQISDMENWAQDPECRLELAHKELDKMRSSFHHITPADIPHGAKDGCIQGAYLAGYQFGTMYLEAYGLYFIGTFLPSLGLEDFKWSDETDEQGRTKSGPVHGSAQFVKCANWHEFFDAIEVVKNHLL